MGRRFAIQLACIVACLSCSCPRSPQITPNSADTTDLAERDAPEGVQRRRPLRPVRVQLVDCEPVEPIAFEETLPDGRVVESVSGRGASVLRLHLQIENLSEQHFTVATCGDALAIVPDNAPRPYCEPPSGSGNWSSLDPGGSGFLYATLPRDLSVLGIFTVTLTPLRVGEPIADWPAYVPDPISFELTSTGCQPATTRISP